MILLELEQGTEEWLDYRRTRVTATDFATYMAHLKKCKNIYRKSLSSLIKDKKSGKIIADNKYFKLGRDKEEEILSTCEFIDMQHGLVGLSSYNDKIMSSFDGVDDILECVYEIKASTKDVFKFQEQVEFYQYQVLHEARVAEYKNGHLAIGYYKEDLCNGNYFWKHQATLHTDIDIDKLMSHEEWIKHCNDFLEILNK